ncbi:Oidioi.mRNA.OKI2018_I69.chr1.g2089.t1.cds [Oikopleura dioica]|uniref:Oidioi.mRNA.OKI2018_I69.chr1.g2089.t1.cds n=1 Tax=Oikopleura dioica TaxID=34765 RepID=A0ABN7SU80_OIKDI|nr:Oidioi.mRNA.OKI2018_I69.chr1.g2089.t1.cds [Oikopleura dioica]
MESKKSKEENNLGTLFFSLDYSFDANLLKVHVKKATNLPAMDIGGTSDPYVKLFFLPDKKRKLSTKKTNKKPIKVFGIYDYDRFGKHDSIGSVQIPLSSIDLAEPFCGMKPIKSLTQTTLGDICFSLRYVPTSGKMTVGILEAKNLKKMDAYGLSDPYVKIYLNRNGKRLKKKKTSVKKNTLTPYYNESFAFEVTQEQLQSVELVIKVVDHDQVGSNDPIGKVVLSKKATGQALKHWMGMINVPRRPVALWHTLEPDED